MSFRDAVFADYEASFHRRPSWLRVGAGVLTRPGFRAAFYYRIGHGARRRGIPLVGPLMDRRIRASCLVDICSLAEIGPGLCLPHPIGIVVGGLAKIGRNCHLLQGVTLGGSGKKKPDGQSQPRVGDDVLIGAGAKLIGPITVGSRVQIGANAVVTGDLPDDCVAVGIPARVLRRTAEPPAGAESVEQT